MQRENQVAGEVTAVDFLKTEIADKMGWKIHNRIYDNNDLMVYHVTNIIFYHNLTYH